MGYRSDVAIAAYGNKQKLAELKAHYDNAVAGLNEAGADDLKWLLKSSEQELDRPVWDPETGDFMFYVCYVKWYDGYPAVDLFNGIYNKATELELAAEFVRTGEDFDDNEQNFYDGDDGEYECECEYRFGIARSITW